MEYDVFYTKLCFETNRTNMEKLMQDGIWKLLLKLDMHSL